MADAKIIFKKDDDFYVGERVFVEVRLFDEVRRIPALNLSPTLVLTRPDKTTIVNVMAADSDDPSLYRGNGVVDVEGNWRAEVLVGFPTETVFRHDGIYVAT